jgi:hypothetical protein
MIVLCRITSPISRLLLVRSDRQITLAVEESAGSEGAECEDDPDMPAASQAGPEVAVAMTSAERIQHGH